MIGMIAILYDVCRLLLPFFTKAISNRTRHEAHKTDIYEHDTRSCLFSPVLQSVARSTIPFTSLTSLTSFPETRALPSQTQFHSRVQSQITSSQLSIFLSETRRLITTSANSNGQRTRGFGLVDWLVGSARRPETMNKESLLRERAEPG